VILGCDEFSSGIDSQHPSLEGCGISTRQPPSMAVRQQKSAETKSMDVKHIGILFIEARESAE
jgi:hypothetical protein